MSTIEIKQALHHIINDSDPEFIKKIYELVVNYKNTLQHEKMILEAEEDIKNGKIHSLESVKKMFNLD